MPLITYLASVLHRYAGKVGKVIKISFICAWFCVEFHEILSLSFQRQFECVMVCHVLFNTFSFLTEWIQLSSVPRIK